MIKPYGADRLVNQIITEEEWKQIVPSHQKAPTVTLDAFMLMECQRIADGSFTPVDGFCTKAEMDAIMQESRLLSGIFFPIPIFLQIPPETTDGLPSGGRIGYTQSKLTSSVLLKDKDGRAIGVIEEPEIFQYDLQLLSRFIFGTDDGRHPGVAQLFSKGDLFIGGKIKAAQMTNSLSRYCLSPTKSREEIAAKGWRTCVGFQTRNVPHLAHEYLQKTVMEIFDGLLIHPVIGWKKKDDYMPEVVMGAYRYLVENIYPKENAMLSGLQIQMRYAGPKEAVFHAIVRQNYGCSHFIVGRDHAGVGGYYGLYEAHEMAKKVQAELDIQILRLRGPRYCSRCESIVTDHTCAHDASYISEVSGTAIRECILAGQYPPKEFIRSEIVDQIMKYERIFV